MHKLIEITGEVLACASLFFIPWAVLWAVEVFA